MNPNVSVSQQDIAEILEIVCKDNEGAFNALIACQSWLEALRVVRSLSNASYHIEETLRPALISSSTLLIEQCEEQLSQFGRMTERLTLVRKQKAEMKLLGIL